MAWSVLHVAVQQHHQSGAGIAVTITDDGSLTNHYIPGQQTCRPNVFAALLQHAGLQSACQLTCILAAAVAFALQTQSRLDHDHGIQLLAGCVMVQIWSLHNQAYEHLMQGSKLK